MSEFTHTGNPPVGEAGVIRFSDSNGGLGWCRVAAGKRTTAYKDCGARFALKDLINISDRNFFSTKPWRWATFAEVSAEVGEKRAREMVHPSQLPAPAGFVPPGAEKPWVPPVPEGFGPWVEASEGYPKGIETSMVAVLTRREREQKAYSFAAYVYSEPCHWSPGLYVAYCVKLEDQPTQEQVEATQQPETPEADALDGGDNAKQAETDPDAFGIFNGRWDRFNARQAWQKPTDPPPFMVRDVRSSDGLLTVREADHRLGLWE